MAKEMSSFFRFSTTTTAVYFPIARLVDSGQDTKKLSLYFWMVILRLTLFVGCWLRMVL